ncbi:hypothetical protein RYX36_012726, partial [Vicia faba]
CNIKTTKIMSRSGLGNECEFPLGFDKPYESPPQLRLLGSQSNFPLHRCSLSLGHLNYPPEIISYSNVPFFSTATLPFTSTNTSKKRRGRPYGPRNKKSDMNIVYEMDISSLKSHMIIVNIEERKRVPKGSTSNPPPTPSALIFPNLKICSKANAEKYLKLADYHISRERAFDCTNFQDFSEIVEMLQQRQWERFNNIIGEMNKTIGLDFYANETFLSNDSYTSYVRANATHKAYRLARVPTHPDDIMISPKDPINASTIRRFKHKKKSTDTHQEHENNQAGIDDDCYHLDIQILEALIQNNQQVSEFQRRMEA